MAIAKEQIRQIIADSNLTNVADVYAYPKEGFKDILPCVQQVTLYVSADCVN